VEHLYKGTPKSNTALNINHHYILKMIFTIDYNFQKQPTSVQRPSFSVPSVAFVEMFHCITGFDDSNNFVILSIQNKYQFSKCYIYNKSFTQLMGYGNKSELNGYKSNMTSILTYS